MKDWGGKTAVLTVGTRCPCTDLFPLFPARGKPCFNRDGLFQKQGEVAPHTSLPAKKKSPYLINLYSFPKRSQAVVPLGGGAEKQHLREELVAPCSPELQTGSGTAWTSCRGPTPTPAPSLSAPRGEAEEGKAGCRVLGRCPRAGPAGPSAPHSFLLAGWCKDLQLFRGRLIAETSRAQIWAQSGRKWGGSWGWACYLLVGYELQLEGDQKKTTFFFLSLKPSQVPAQRAQGVLCSQLFPSKASPCLQNVEPGSGRASWSRNALR